MNVGMFSLDLLELYSSVWVANKAEDDILLICTLKGQFNADDA